MEPVRLKRQRPQSTAKRARKYREKLKENDAAGTKEKERNRWHQRKAAEKVKTISKMSKKQQRYKRKKWNQDNQKRAEKKKHERALHEATAKTNSDVESESDMH